MVVDLNNKRERVLEIVKRKGPLLPVRVAKEIDTDIMFAGALLSELISGGKIKITSVKIGGSPLYYIEEQKRKLQEFIKNLNEKDQKTVALLKEKRILRDIDCDSLQRVSLREIKDFAKPIQVKEDDKIELFWKWYLVDDEVAKELIREFIGKKAVRGVIKKLPVEKLVKVEQVKEKPKIKKVREDIGLKAVNEYFVENNIRILKVDVIKKNREMNYIVEVNSDVGKLNFFVKFKDKKKLDDGDLSLALNEAKKMPLMFLTTGNLTKKAEKLVESDFNGVIFRKL